MVSRGFPTGQCPACSQMMVTICIFLAASMQSVKKVWKKFINWFSTGSCGKGQIVNEAKKWRKKHGGGDPWVIEMQTQLALYLQLEKDKRLKPKGLWFWLERSWQQQQLFNKPLTFVGSLYQEGAKHRVLHFCSLASFCFCFFVTGLKIFEGVCLRSNVFHLHKTAGISNYATVSLFFI